METHNGALGTKKRIKGLNNSILKKNSILDMAQPGDELSPSKSISSGVLRHGHNSNCLSKCVWKTPWFMTMVCPVAIKAPISTSRVEHAIWGNVNPCVPRHGHLCLARNKYTLCSLWDKSCSLIGHISISRTLILYNKTLYHGST